MALEHLKKIKKYAFHLSYTKKKKSLLQTKKMGEEEVKKKKKIVYLPVIERIKWFLDAITLHSVMVLPLVERVWLNVCIDVLFFFFFFCGGSFLRRPIGVWDDGVIMNAFLSLFFFFGSIYI